MVEEFSHFKLPKTERFFENEEYEEGGLSIF